MSDTPTPAALYAAASALIAAIGACPCATVPATVYALCARCACRRALAQALRASAREGAHHA